MPNHTPIPTTMHQRRKKMKLNEFILQFAQTHTVQHINDLKKGVIKKPITNNIYLVSNKEVTQ